MHIKKDDDNGLLPKEEEEARENVPFASPLRVHSFHGDRRHNVLSRECSDSHFEPIGMESVPPLTNQERRLEDRRNKAIVLRSLGEASAGVVHPRV